MADTFTELLAYPKVTCGELVVCVATVSNAAPAAFRAWVEQPRELVG